MISIRTDLFCEISAPEAAVIQIIPVGYRIVPFTDIDPALFHPLLFEHTLILPDHVQLEGIFQVSPVCIELIPFYDLIWKKHKRDKIRNTLTADTFPALLSGPAHGTADSPV